jgi:Polysaccharide biosynthesis/export protein
MIPAGSAALTRRTPTMKLAPRLGLKWLIVFVLGAAVGMLTMRMNSWESIEKARMARIASRGLAPVPPGFFDIASLATKDPSGPAVIGPGRVLIVEALESLPGRPLTGERLVHPDGKISLGWYGEVQVAGLNRNQIKVKVIEHLRKYINDETLGLVRKLPDGKVETIPPVESDRLFVEETDDPSSRAIVNRSEIQNLGGRIIELDAKLDRVLKELEDLRKERPPANAPEAIPSPSLPSPPVSKPGY